ncbi:MAG: GNAT family N-acetyltransferase [Proteobacteria bacterium]|nr:GNAT family N-acetyltransferase [Pseudomonadota bacterium]
MTNRVMDKIRIRPMAEGDLDAIVSIDEKVLGEKRYGYWRRKIKFDERDSEVTGLVAEVDGKIVGFILGEMSGQEFRVPYTIGWIDTIGIDPAYQRRGLATVLLDEVIKNFRQMGIETIYTLVNWSSWDLLQFFKNAGFTRGDMINLELKL